MSSASEKDILVETRKNGVTTLRMNLPKQLNGWTGPMMLAIRAAFSKLSTDPETKVAILTGTDPYYCAGMYEQRFIEGEIPNRKYGSIM